MSYIYDFLQGLVESVRNILWEANKLKLTSLIIPTQEFTELNYPSNIIAEVLYKEMFSVFCPHSNTLRKVFIVVSTTEEHECFENVHHRFMRNIPDMVRCIYYTSIKWLRYFKIILTKTAICDIANTLDKI